MSRRNWKTLQPTSLREAMELCKDHARERLNKGVERIADDMGVSDTTPSTSGCKAGACPPTWCALLSWPAASTL